LEESIWKHQLTSNTSVTFINDDIRRVQMTMLRGMDRFVNRVSRAMMTRVMHAGKSAASAPPQPEIVIEPKEEGKEEAADA